MVVGKEVTGRLSAAEAQLGRLAVGLNTVENRVAHLQEELAEHSRAVATLQLRTKDTETRLTTARSLLQKLDTEHHDWQAQLEEFSTRKERLDLEAANVASLLVYQNFEKDDEWKKSAIDLLINEREKLIWRAQGLPADTESLVAAACALRGPMVPLFMDSSGITVSWLKRNIGSALEIIKFEDAKFLITLESAMRFGKPVLVEELVEFPPILLPLLRQRSIRLGERTLQAQKGFKLFLASRREQLDNLPIDADTVLYKVTLGTGINSLVERFTDKILLKEVPEIATQRREMLEREEKLSGERDAARLELLDQLGAARGHDLLQEPENLQGGSLLSSLESTQSKAKEITAALQDSRRSFVNISRRAKNHERTATFAAKLYKSLMALITLNPLYVFSTEAFMDIYLEAESLENTIVLENTAEQNSERHELIKRRLTTLILHHCCKAAYRKHRLPIALHLALSLYPATENEKHALLGIDRLNNDEDKDYQVPEWVPDERRPAVKLLAKFFPHVSKITS
ncbi:hypothetical protein KM043_000132 [Ampulex compressa]|nr:hypothetical protein KM043_000132 [Ampulex compressa]